MDKPHTGLFPFTFTLSLFIGLWLFGTMMMFLGVMSTSNAVHQRSLAENNRNFTTTSRIDYQTAIGSLRCFVTPGCFPNKKCRTGEVKRIPSNKNRVGEEKGFCVDDLPIQQKTRDSNTLGNTESLPCVIYSFGLDGNTEVEQKMASLGCEVHGFDPTKRSPNAPGFTFHPWGLQGAGTNMSETHSVNYKALDNAKLFPLSTIMKRLGHKKLDLLLMDCEGCEWGVLREIACNGDSAAVDQLLLELHFQKSLGLASDEDVRVAGEAVRCLERERWSMVSIQRSQCNPADAEYVGEVPKIVNIPNALYHVALQRTPPTEPLPWELLRDVADAMRKERAARGSRKKGAKLHAPEKRARRNSQAAVAKYEAQQKANPEQYDQPQTLNIEEFRQQRVATEE